jgi:EAL domain-containing protein (putative c-di-GMP-specific phosphodiesterase class I)
LSEPFNVGGKKLLFSSSIGVAINSQNYKQSDEMLRDANTALHRAKSLGKARHQIFDVSMHQHAMQRLGLEGDLRRAIVEGEFELYYQPFISLETEQIVGFEALIRWQRPGHGTVLPQEFISVAEENGLIVPLGSWVLREGCRQIHEWKTRFPAQRLKIGINVASQQISQSDLVGEVTQALQDFDLDAADLELEVTESGIIENPVAAADAMKEIHRLGVRLSIDDFGTGYSSLSQLYRYQFDVLKIDRSFISQLCAEDDNSLLFVRTILRLAKDQGMSVVAEGIETEEQLRKLQELECDIGQGYYFSRPLPRDEATKLLE